MRAVAITGAASLVADADGRTDAELLAPVVDAALADSGLSRDDVGVVCSAGSELLNGVVGSMMGAFDAFPGWPPRTHVHHEGDGAFALHEAWIRLLAGDGEAALVCALSRPLADDPERPLALQHDPYLVAPLGPGRRHAAALQARALLDSGRVDEDDLLAVVAARRGLDVVQLRGEPQVAPPLREADCPTVRSGAAAVVLTTGALVDRSGGAPAWISGIEQEIEGHALGARDLTRSPSTRAASSRLGLVGSRIDVAEVHAPFSHQELVVLDALGCDVGTVNPSGGALVADPIMATGLIRVVEAATAIARDGAHRTLGHATNGPCLQHNLVCLLEASEPAVGS